MQRIQARRVEVRQLTRLLKALGDETRLRMVALLAHGELCVCHLESALELSQPTASRHLAVLRAAGVVDSRREGTWVHYKLARQADPDCKGLMRSLASGFARRHLLRQDLERVLRKKGPGSCR
jgi:ArsR family transcriptional regulator